MDFIGAALSLFAYSNQLRLLYLILTALGFLLGVLLFVKHPFFKVAQSKSPRKKWTKLAATMIAIAIAFATLQHMKILQFEEGPRCESVEDNVLYLPLWVDEALAPYLAETFQHYASDCVEIADRIAAARFGWSRYVTIGLHLLLSLLMVASLAVCLSNVSAILKKSVIGDE